MADKKLLGTFGDTTDIGLVSASGVQLTPVGSIVAYNPGYYTGTSNGGFTLAGPSANTVAGVNAYLPANWRVCDGAALNDADSPIWSGANRYLPNLTGDRFLMGSTTISNLAATAAGGNNSSAHNHTIPAHYHRKGTLAIGASGSHSHTANNTGVNLDGAAGTAKYTPATNSATTSTTHSHTNADFTGLVGATGSGNDGDAGTMTTGAASATDNRPAYLQTFFIVRVK